MLLSLPRPYSVALRLGFLKGKSALRIPRALMRTQGTLLGRSFWSRGDRVSAAGLYEALIRRQIQKQEKYERHQERDLFGNDQ